jgi:hypothetical protein
MCAPVLVCALLFGVLSLPSEASATLNSFVSIEPPVGAANGSVVATGTGFTPGQAVTVANETTTTTVCSTVVAPDGTFACSGLAEATAGTTSSIGVGGVTGFYRSAGTDQIATVAGGGTGDGGPSTGAAVGFVQGVASDAAGDVYFD